MNGTSCEFHQMVKKCKYLSDAVVVSAFRTGMRILVANCVLALSGTAASQARASCRFEKICGAEQGQTMRRSRKRARQSLGKPFVLVGNLDGGRDRD